MSIDEPLQMTVEVLLGRGREAHLIATKSHLWKKAFNRGRAYAYQDAALYVAAHAPLWDHNKVKELIERIGGS